MSDPEILALIGPQVLREAGRRYYVRTPRTGQRVVLDSPERVARHFRARLEDQPQEHFFVVTVDPRLRILGTHLVAKGGISHVHVLPREVFRPAILDGATGILIAHNHPTGDPEPSQEDVELTARLRQAGELIGIKVLDHLVVGREGYVSLRERGQV